MKLGCFKTLWGHEGSFEEACIEAKKAGFVGIEGQLPASRQERDAWKQALQRHGLYFIQEIVTGGDYVPDRTLGVDDHLEDIRRALQHSHEVQPLFATCIGGCDAWSDELCLEFFSRGMAIARDHGIVLRFETHRSRCLFTPWRTRSFIEALPELELTADISHWCVVCERQMTTEMETIASIAPNVKHIHARVGYDQGPQVPDPRAPEYSQALASHQQCWERFWEAMRHDGMDAVTMTPEFGPDGYLHTLPFTQAPVADLWEINCWMARTEREHFDAWQKKERA